MDDDEVDGEARKRRRRSVRNIRRRSELVPFNLNTLDGGEQHIKDDCSKEQLYGSLWMETQEPISRKKIRRSSLFVGLSVRPFTPPTEDTPVINSDQDECHHFCGGQDESCHICTHRAQESSCETRTYMPSECSGHQPLPLRGLGIVNNSSATDGNNDMHVINNEIKKDETMQYREELKENPLDSVNTCENSAKNPDVSLHLNVCADTSVNGLLTYSTPSNDAGEQQRDALPSMSPDFPASPSGSLYINSHNESYVDTTAYVKRDDATACVKCGDATACVKHGDTTACVKCGDTTACVKCGDTTACVKCSDTTACVKCGDTKACINHVDTTECVDQVDTTECVDCVDTTAYIDEKTSLLPTIIQTCDSISITDVSDKENRVVTENVSLNNTGIDQEKTNETSPGFFSMCKSLAGKVGSFVKTSPSYLTNFIFDSSNTSQNCASPILQLNHKLINQVSPNNATRSFESQVDHTLQMMERKINSEVMTPTTADENLVPKPGVCVSCFENSVSTSVKDLSPKQRGQKVDTFSVKKMKDRKTFFDTFNAISVELQKEKLDDNTPDPSVSDATSPAENNIPVCEINKDSVQLLHTENGLCASVQGKDNVSNQSPKKKHTLFPSRILNDRYVTSETLSYGNLASSNRQMKQTVENSIPLYDSTDEHGITELDNINCKEASTVEDDFINTEAESEKQIKETIPETSCIVLTPSENLSSCTVSAVQKSDDKKQNVVSSEHVRNFDTSETENIKEQRHCFDVSTEERNECKFQTSYKGNETKIQEKIKESKSEGQVEDKNDLEFKQYNASSYKPEIDRRKRKSLNIECKEKKTISSKNMTLQIHSKVNTVPSKNSKLSTNASRRKSGACSYMETAVGDKDIVSRKISKTGDKANVSISSLAENNVSETGGPECDMLMLDLDNPLSGIDPKIGAEHCESLTRKRRLSVKVEPSIESVSSKIVDVNEKMKIKSKPKRRKSENCKGLSSVLEFRKSLLTVQKEEMKKISDSRMNQEENLVVEDTETSFGSSQATDNVNLAKDLLNLELKNKILETNCDQSRSLKKKRGRPKKVFIPKPCSLQSTEEALTHCPEFSSLGTFVEIRKTNVKSKAETNRKGNSFDLVDNYTFSVNEKSKQKIITVQTKEKVENDCIESSFFNDKMEEKISVENLKLPKDIIVPKRQRRKSAEAATLKIQMCGDDLTVPDSPMKEDNWISGSTTAANINKKRKLNKKETAEELEMIYKNKNYLKPEERKPWQTIHEAPDVSGELYGKRRLQRYVEFEKPSQMKIRRRLQKASKNGWDPKKRRKCELKDEFVQAKLEKLFAEIDTEKTNSEAELLVNKLKKIVETE